MLKFTIYPQVERTLKIYFYLFFSHGVTVKIYNFFFFINAQSIQRNKHHFSKSFKLAHRHLKPFKKVVVYFVGFTVIILVQTEKDRILMVVFLESILAKKKLYSQFFVFSRLILIS